MRMSLLVLQPTKAPQIITERAARLKSGLNTIHVVLVIGCSPNQHTPKILPNLKSQLIAPNDAIPEFISTLLVLQSKLQPLHLVNITKVRLFWYYSCKESIRLKSLFDSVRVHLLQHFVCDLGQGSTFVAFHLAH